MSTLHRRLDDLHPKMLRMRSEGERKPLAELSETDRKRYVGQSVERALVLAKVTKQEAAFGMGYEDQGVVSRWISGLERPLFDKLFALKGFRKAWILALAEQDEQIEIETNLRLRVG